MAENSKDDKSANKVIKHTVDKIDVSMVNDAWQLVSREVG